MDEGKKFQDVMLDLETLGTGPNAPIISIGAACFNPLTGEIGAKFYQAIEAESCAELGAEMDAGTVAWWMKQSDEARAVFDDPDAVVIGVALILFSRFLDGVDSPKIWGNGAGFDNVILRQAFTRMSHQLPWKHWNDRDVRTVVDLGRSILGIDPKKDIPREGTFHNALDDAIHQIRYVSEIVMALAKSTGPSEAA